MKIKEIKINSYGNIQNKEIQLIKGINLIYGNNESGKSTLLHFITHMFYGISKNKRGKIISDYDKYLPWNTEEFSGKINYELDSGETFEVFRNFKKKDPVILNSQYEDVTSQYVVDKTNGNQFFFEQTKMNEETFLSSVVSEQNQVEIDKQTQNILIQKLANIAGTGDDTISYKKAMDKLNKKQTEEIGTNRTQEKPINVVQKRIEELEKQKKEIVCLKNKIIDLEKEESQIQNKLTEKKEEIEIAKQLKKIKEKEELEKEKIKINKNTIENYEKEKIILEKNKKENENKKEKIQEKNIKKWEEEKNKIKNNQIKKILLILSILLIFIFFIQLIFMKNNILNIILGVLIILDFAVFIAIILHNKNKIKNIEKEIQKINDENKIKQELLKNIEQEIEKNNSQIEIYNKNIIEQKKFIEKINEKMNFEKNIEINQIKNKYKKEINEKLNLENLENELQEIQIQEHRLQLEKENMIPKIEQLTSIEEELELLQEQKENLQKDNTSIELAKTALEEAYQIMKQNVTPKFTTQLSQIMQKISNGKYKQVRLTEQEGIIVEKEEGDYVNINRLSIGTITQLYLSLRIAASKELCSENMPIILDEAFAYYDTERLKNILIYIYEEFKQNQIILFTCTQREKELLEKEKIPFHMITM